jgi:hypothetical protein
MEPVKELWRDTLEDKIFQRVMRSVLDTVQLRKKLPDHDHYRWQLCNAVWAYYDSNGLTPQTTFGEDMGEILGPHTVTGICAAIMRRSDSPERRARALWLARHLGGLHEQPPHLRAELQAIIDHESLFDAFPLDVCECSARDVFANKKAESVLECIDDVCLLFSQCPERNGAFLRCFEPLTSMLEPYIDSTQEPPAYTQDFPSEFWDEFCLRNLEKIARTVIRRLREDAHTCIITGRRPLLQYLMETIWLKHPALETTAFFPAFYTRVGPVVHEQLRAYFADPKPLRPKPVLSDFVRLLELNQRLLLIDATALAWDVPADSESTHYCRDQAHLHFCV